MSGVTEYTDENPCKVKRISLNLGIGKFVLTIQVYKPNAFLLFGIGLTEANVKVYVINEFDPIVIYYVPSSIIKSLLSSIDIVNV